MTKRAETIIPRAKTAVAQEPCHELLRRIADEMESGEWEPQEAAVLISRDAEGYLTFCGWGDWGNLIEQAHITRKATA